ncbi:MAG: Alx protein [Herminiimonas sp.]|nr:Alx protein [Herminiimonas sp.]
MESIGNVWLWSGFGVVVLGMLLVDLLVVGGGKENKVSLRAAGAWSVVWIVLSLAFAAVLWWVLDETAGRAVANQKSLEFVTGYLIEKSLAIDNVFIWLLLFSYFQVPITLQKRVLVYGVLGAIVLRAVMIFAGAWLIAQFHWVLYLFGAFLVITGIRMWLMGDQDPDLAANPVIRWVRTHMKITTEFHGERFFTIQNGTRYATPLFMALVLVELSDVVFAVDSIPAIFAVTTDPFIVLTSNVFAILGLRAMYFLLADFANRFSLLKYGLAVVLVFIGTKMLLAEVYEIPVGVSLGVVAAIIGMTVWLSLRRSARDNVAAAG